MLRISVAAFAALFATLITQDAFAADAQTHEPDAQASTEPRSRVVALSLNALAVGVGRAGGNVELSLAPHHELVVSAFGAVRSVSYVGGDTVVTRPSLGGEAGYRYLFGRRSFAGPFVGASVLAERVIPESGSYGTMLLGGAVDFGGQVVTRGGLLIGAGLGVQYTASTAPRVAASAMPVFASAGVLPRLLLSVGYAF